MRYSIKLFACVIATLAMPAASSAQASTYTCQDLYGATSAFDASLAAYDAANISGREADLQDQWRNCLDNVSDREAMIWCDQEYEASRLALFEEEQFLLLDITIKQSEMEMISNQLASDGITCT